MSVQAKQPFLPRYPLPIVQPAAAALLPCSHGAGCPLGVDAPGIASALLAGDHRRAYRIARGPNPFASSCGHGCHAPCERACRRRYFGAPVAIAALEAHASALSIPALLASPEPCTSAHDARSVAALAGYTPEDAPRAPRSGHRVAIIGAGAAGLACAHDLTLLGHTCAVFDAAPEPGGLLTSALPPFRFPAASARTECAAILDLGVEYHDSYRIEGSGDLRALLAGEFDAVFLAIGASAPHEPLFPDQPEHEQVIDAMRVLTENLPATAATIVAGDGDLAVDAARTAKHRAARDRIANASVQLVLDRSIEESTAAPSLLGAALSEGIIIHAGWSATRYSRNADGALAGVEIARPAERAAQVLACDRIITAGQRAPHSLPFTPELALDNAGHIAVNPETLETSMYGVWAGGACAFGHRSIAHATADGKRAAWQIHGTLTRRPVRITIASAWVEADEWDDRRAARATATHRIETTTPPPADPFSADALRSAADIQREAARCFDCATVPVVDEERCTRCGTCVSTCPVQAFSMHAGPPKQLRLDQDVCTRCGICMRKCPEDAIAMLRAVWEERLAAASEPSLPDFMRPLRDATPAGGTPTV